MLSFFHKYYSENFIHNKYNHLLIMLIFSFVAYPLFNHGELQFPFIPLIILVLIILTLNTVIVNKGLFFITVFLASLAFILQLSAQYSFIPSMNGSFIVFSGILNVIFLNEAIIILTRSLFAHTEVTSDTIKGGVVIYFLLGIVWGILYKVLYFFDPNSFSRGQLWDPEFFYFSFVTLTTLGYGDIVPISRYAMNLAILEAIVGQIFLAIFIARLVGMHIAQSLNRTFNQ